jgi:hypothetical protein
VSALLEGGAGESELREGIFSLGTG